jgi:hypothetical protein
MIMMYYKIKAWYLGMSYSKEYIGKNFNTDHGIIYFWDPFNKNKKYYLSAQSADCIETEVFDGEVSKDILEDVNE